MIKRPTARPLFAIGPCLSDLGQMPAKIKDAFGRALRTAQNGEYPEDSRPFGEGLPREVLKLAEDCTGDTYRAAFVVEFPECVYLLHVFKKKSASGRATPRPAIETIRGTTGCRPTALPRHIPIGIGKMIDDEQMVTEVGDDLFEILGIPNAADVRARVDLASAITGEIRRRGLTQTRAAKLLGIKQPDVSAIMNARIDGFSQERLERLLNALDMDVRIQVGPRPAGKKRAGITVQRVDSF